MKSMKRMTLIVILLATPAFASDAPNYHAIDEMQEKANSYISTLEAQRNAALNQVVALTAEVERLKKAKDCGK